MVGDGSRIRFWKDVWGGEEALCITFPTLFSLAVQKDAMIREIWDFRTKVVGPLGLAGHSMTGK